MAVEVVTSPANPVPQRVVIGCQESDKHAHD